MTTTHTRLATAGASLVLAAGALAAGTSTAGAAPIAPSCDGNQYTVTSVVTAKSAATICQWGNGDLEYRGVARSSGNTLCIPVSGVFEQENGSGRYYYVAYNNGYKYSVFDGLGLSIVGPDGLLISSEDAI